MSYGVEAREQGRGSRRLQSLSWLLRTAGWHRGVLGTAGQTSQAASPQKPPASGLNHCIPSLQETAACRIGAIETLMGTPDSTMKH